MARKTARAKPRLTLKQEAFTLAYLETGKAAEAYRRAFDVADAVASSWVYVEASKLLRHPKIALRLKRLRLDAQKPGYLQYLIGISRIRRRQVAGNEGKERQRRSNRNQGQGSTIWARRAQTR